MTGFMSLACSMSEAFKRASWRWAWSEVARLCRVGYLSFQGSDNSLASIVFRDL